MRTLASEKGFQVREAGRRFGSLSERRIGVQNTAKVLEEEMLRVYTHMRIWKLYTAIRLREN
jgi:hypothetical protein